LDRSAALTPESRITFRYMLGFQCIAGACRENCCTGLRVQLTEENHRRLEARSAAIPRLQQLFQLHVRAEPPPLQSESRFSFIEPDGPQCPYLDEDWLCAIQRAVGEEALANPCSLFPRTITEVNGRRELTATLACPEAARLCLTMPDAVDSVPYEPSLVAREIVVRRHEDASVDPYVALLDDVRQVCLDVLFLEGPSTVEKLGLLLDFAARIEGVFHRGTSTFDPSVVSAAVESLGARLPLVQATVAQTPPASLRGVKALGEMLLARLGSSDNRRFDAFVRPLLLAGPAPETTEAVRALVTAYFAGNAPGAVDFAGLVARAQATAAWLEPAFGRRIDGFLQRAAINSVVKDWYTAQPTLAASLRRLVVRLALSRFLLVLHPQVVEGLEASALDDAAVDSFQVVAKNVEHVPSFMDLCEAYLGEQGLGSVEGATALLRA
jgi:lysine-N-methylase